MIARCRHFLGLAWLLTACAASVVPGASPTHSGMAEMYSTAPTLYPSVPLTAFVGSPTAASSFPVSPTNIYAATAAGSMSAIASHARPLVYVPSNDQCVVAEIDPKTRKEIARYNVGKEVQHVVRSRDLSRLYANASGANQIVPIDPVTGKPGVPIPVDAPYNLYFSPDGTRAIVMAERLRRIDYHDPVTWKLIKSMPVPCRGINHADWSADLAYFIATCEFSGDLLKLDSASGEVLGSLGLKAGAMPQDIRLSPDSRKFYVAEMANGGLWTVDGTAFAVTGFIPTGAGTHGIYPSRDATRLFVSNRGRDATVSTSRRSKPGEGSVSVLDPATDTVTATWQIPGGGSPDMGGVSADGSELWLYGPYDAVVYVFNTLDDSLGHTGYYR